jgi:hypothetical protein
LKGILRGLEKTTKKRCVQISSILAPIGHSIGSFGPQQAKMGTLFYESRNLTSVRLSEAKLELEKEPNNAFWEAKVG